jgi:hypothetical protein
VRDAQKLVGCPVAAPKYETASLQRVKVQTRGRPFHNRPAPLLGARQPFLVASPLVQHAGVLEGDGPAGGQGRQDEQVLLVEPTRVVGVVHFETG